MEMVGIQDVFGQSGSPRELLENYNLMPKDIITAARRVIKRK
jgi:transketolase